ncbi:hypothetical protein [Halorubrum sp. Hd13]|uniref:hypothetical protein n=1 Tax=Halorubrum sp. Hd13 TaxID=1480728 RepID=UPI000BD79AB6|nr:hypothetical protein [Halorubrum sp. Hd13]OYR40856.1 hypothetical protein DJ81_13335 [Halorubrum sp. Hd13]OYR50199.1 hypothetical protein DJ75_00345 [Halorubrum sp. Eb13]
MVVAFGVVVALVVVTFAVVVAFTVVVVPAVVVALVGLFADRYPHRALVSGIVAAVVHRRVVRLVAVRVVVQRRLAVVAALALQFAQRVADGVAGRSPEEGADPGADRAAPSPRAPPP